MPFYYFSFLFNRPTLPQLLQVRSSPGPKEPLGIAAWNMDVLFAVLCNQHCNSTEGREGILCLNVQ